MEISAKKKLRVVATSTALFFLAMILTAYTSRNPSIVRTGSALIQQTLVPFQAGSHSISSSITRLWHNYVWLRGVARNNYTMRSEIHDLRFEVARLREYEHQNLELRNMLQMEKDAELSGVIANVVGYDATSWIQSITVDRGSKQGVEIGQAVIHPEGLVGQVIAVSPTTAKVLLITDNASGVDALIQRNRLRGVVSGSYPKGCQLQYVSKEEEVREGDRLITSGMDGLFPKGIPIGLVTSVQRQSWELFHEVKVEPNVSFKRLETVYVVGPKGEA